MTNLPDSYNALLAEFKEKQSDVKPLKIYSAEDIVKFNSLYKISEFAPGAILVGTDGGDEALVVDVRADSLTNNEFFFMPFVTLGWDNAKLAGDSLDKVFTTYSSMTR